MPVTEFIVENVSNVVNPPGKIYDVAGVDIAPGESRNKKFVRARCDTRANRPR